MRQKISDRNVFPKFDIEKEYEKLDDLYSRNLAMGYGDSGVASLTFAECFDRYFLDWPLRGSYTSDDELRKVLHITDSDFLHGVSEDILLDYIQYVYNAIDFVCQLRDEGIFECDHSIKAAIRSNCELIMRYLDAEMQLVNGEYFVVYKDDVATAVAEQNQDIKASITEYLKIDNRGDINRKAEVLCTLAKKLEENKDAYKGNEFSKLYTDTTTLLNTSGIRHAQSERQAIDKNFKDMDSNELEKWYNRTFQMVLACLAVLPYIGFKNEIESLKKV